MTQEEWWTSTDSHQMLDFLAEKYVGSPFVDGFRVGGGFVAPDLDPPYQGRRKWHIRKFCLFNVACCRRVWPWLAEDHSRRAVEVAERFADGLASEEERIESFDAAGRITGGRETMQNAWSDRELNPEGWIAFEAHGAAHVAAACHRCDDWYFYGGCARITARALASRTESEGVAERAAQADLLRDLFGLVSRPTVVDPAWLNWGGGIAVDMAETIYSERSLPEGLFDTSWLAVLSDALEDAGCDDATLLGHLRGPGLHVRGCWALDLILGKA